MARGSRITLSITHRRAKAQAVSPDSRFKMLSNQERQQRQGRGGFSPGKQETPGFQPSPSWLPRQPIAPAQTLRGLARVMGVGGELWVPGDTEMRACLFPSLPVYGRPLRCWWTLRAHGRFLAICLFAFPQVGVPQEALKRGDRDKLLVQYHL